MENEPRVMELPELREAFDHFQQIAARLVRVFKAFVVLHPWDGPPFRESINGTAPQFYSDMNFFLHVHAWQEVVKLTERPTDRVGRTFRINLTSQLIDFQLNHHKLWTDELGSLSADLTRYAATLAEPRNRLIAHNDGSFDASVGHYLPGRGGQRPPCLSIASPMNASTS